MNKILFSFLFLAFSFSLIGQEKYSKVEITVTQSQMETLEHLDIALDHIGTKKGANGELIIIGEFSPYELQQIQGSTLTYEITNNDLSTFYAERAAADVEGLEALNCGGNDNIGGDFDDPINFVGGSMGGFMTYQEILDDLDKMSMMYPNLITTRAEINTQRTHENRPIYWLRISDNPTVNENETEIMYSALHHAREPLSNAQMMYYMWYLLENYASNPEIKHLVDNTELYFVPVVNPDGYVYNETTNPNGGGLWRKNRRDNQDGNFGVDLNRNYGYEWGYDNSGSSPNTGSDVYRGTSGFSEPETQMMKFFCEQHEFEMVFNYHSYTDLLIYPWGYDQVEVDEPDLTLFKTHADHLTRANNYFAGTGFETVGYAANGNSDDWMYGEDVTKNKSYSYTPEIGHPADGFWPDPTLILENVRLNLIQNISFVWLNHKYLFVEDLSSDNISTATGTFDFKAKRLGTVDGANYTVEFESLSSALLFTGTTTFNYTNFLIFDELQDNVAFSIVDNTVSSVDFVIKTDNGEFIRRDTITKFLNGSSTPIFSDNASDLNNWSSNDWNITAEKSVSPSTSITDSPNSNYSANENNLIILNDLIDLTNAVKASISFEATWDIESGYDYVKVYANSTALCGNYTRTVAGEPLYDGSSPWVSETMSLDAFLGQSDVEISFYLYSDGGLEEDGFYFDDFNVNVEYNVANNDVLAQKISIFPNPNNSGKLYFNGIKNNSEIIITNTLGQEIIREKTTNRSIDINGLSSGIYFFQTNIEGENVVKKFVVK